MIESAISGITSATGFSAREIGPVTVGRGGGRKPGQDRFSQRRQIMRVRLYGVGPRSVGVVFIDEFPASLQLDEDGRIHPEVHSDRGLCQLDEINGQVYLRSNTDTLEVNNAPLREGPLMPGDRLRYEGYDYLVSYEQTQSAPAPPSRYRIMR